MTAEELRAYVLDVFAPAAAAATLANAAEAEASFGDGVEWIWKDDPQWWRGSCDSTCAILEEQLGDDLAPFEVVWWGAFVGDEGDVWSSHCWLAAPDGTIFDPTSEQFGLDPCVIVRPGDPLHDRYVPRGDA